MSFSQPRAAAKAGASMIALGLIAQAGLASAQPADYDRQDDGPPAGQYAPPPDGADAQGAYDQRTQDADRAYADRYSQWAARYCVDRRNNNAAAGAVVGGVLGAIVGSGVAGRGSHTGGAIVGGALGATAGAAIGSSSGDGSSCPPGYVADSGAPAFAYPGYGPAVVYGPSWYNPWIFVGGRWSYRPYRSWYYGHPAYWRRDGRHHY